MRTWPPTALRRVVLVGQHPVDLLGEPARDRRRERAARLRARGPSRRSRRRRPGCARAPRDVMTTSNEPSANGSRVASPRSTPAKSSTVISPASTIAPTVARVSGRPRRRRSRGRRPDRRAGRASNAWRPKPAPTSSTRSPRRRPSLSKRIVSTQIAPVPPQLLDVVRHRQHLAVLVDRHLRAAPPAPPLDDASAPGRADPGAQRGVVEAARDRRGERAGVAGRALQHRVAVGAGHLGQRASVGGDERRAGAHRLDGGQAEALVEARHDGQLGLGVQLDDPLVGHALTRSRCAGAGRAGR